MGLKETTKHMRDLLTHITHDLEKAENGNKAASQRVRTGTVKLEKVAKMFRKESIKTEKATKGIRKPSKKVASKAKVKKSPMKAHAPVHAKIKSKAKAHKAMARPRALSFKKPSAKLPMRRAGAR